MSKERRLSLDIYNRMSKEKQIEYIKKCYNFSSKTRKNRTPEELADGCIYFINMFCQIYDKEKGEYAPFDLYPIQKDYIRDFFSKMRLMVNKSRQCGFTWVTCAILIYCLLFMDGQKMAVISRTGEDAMEVISRIKAILDRLPDFIRPENDKYKTNTKKKIQLKDRRLKNGQLIAGGMIESKTTSDNSARGGNYTAIMWDEAAFIDKKVDGRALYNAALPTLSKNGKFVINSTPNGLGNFYSEMFLKAEAGDNGFDVFKFHWSNDPTRCKKWFQYFEDKRIEAKANGYCYVPTPEDDDYKLLKEEIWYINKFAEMGSEDDFNQEYELSFLNSGRPAFNLQRIKPLYEKDCLNAEIVETRFNKKCIIYEHVKPGKKYIATMDTSEMKGQDPTVFLMFDTSLNQVLEYVDNKEDLGYFLDNVIDILKEYNGAYILFELNNVSGGYTRSKFETVSYPYCYTNPDDYSLGLRTTVATKNLYIQALRDMLYKKNIKIKSYELYKEITRFTCENGKYAAAPGFHDDRVMALSFLVPAIEDFSTWGSGLSAMFV